MNPADQLRAAAQYLQENGWTQGYLYDHGVPMPSPACAVGAMRAVTDGAAEEQNLRDVLSSYLEAEGLMSRKRPTPTARRTLTGWNDDPHTTAEDVILAMKHAAADYESQESK